ncbi:MAG: lysophospholipid acyltransferase family protein [Bacteroidota bacterium]
MTDHLEFILFSFFGFLVRLMPLRLAQSFGDNVGSLAYLIAWRRRTIAIDNLTHAFPEKNRDEIKRIALGAFRNYAISISELLWFPRLTPERLRKFVRVLDVDLAEKMYSRGKGIVYISGHFGNWELTALAAAHFTGYPATIIVQNQRNRLVDKVINGYRCIWGNSIVPMESSVREVLRQLSQGKTVAMLADQSAPMEGLFVPYFGRPAATHQGPAIFSLRTGAPIVMGLLIRKEKGKYELIFVEVRTDDLKEYNDENVAELTRRHVALLEKYVRMYPDQWLWMHRRWKHVDKAPATELASTGSVFAGVSTARTSEVEPTEEVHHL